MGIDVTLRRGRVFRVSGRVADSGVGAVVSLAHREAASVWDYKHHSSITNSAGDFELRGVPPGSYDLLSGPRGCRWKSAGRMSKDFA